MGQLGKQMQMQLNSETIDPPSQALSHQGYELSILASVYENHVHKTPFAESFLFTADSSPFFVDLFYALLVKFSRRQQCQHQQHHLFSSESSGYAAACCTISGVS
jgi:hypothetical protein